MSLCYKFKQFWLLLFDGWWHEKGEKNTPKSQRKKNNINERQVKLNGERRDFQGAERKSDDVTDSQLISRGVQFSSKEDMEGFDSKMDEMHDIFLKELSEIKRQHERLQIGRVILSRRVSELEQILQTDIKSFTSSDIKSFMEDSSLSSEELQLLAEMDEILEMLEKEQQELLSLEKYLDIELRERTYYPEPVMPRHRRLEDEFSKQMKIDGGLKYESFDKTVQFITYRSLPPPLSLGDLLDVADR
ncbi:hypothetical protein AWC38_SpisGene13559 [Stylophora pistillata]|uniref:Uncharacterized protein n=1 Tax=Stylophora pistillata TaxID=50429 RepID=A0A2B4RYN8_STYPI|nr:hypothetical protein AWC38_SpisGene13559 [Stylophora pistillata]